MITCQRVAEVAQSEDVAYQWQVHRPEFILQLNHCVLSVRVRGHDSSVRTLKLSDGIRVRVHQSRDVNSLVGAASLGRLGGTGPAESSGLLGLDRLAGVVGVRHLVENDVEGGGTVGVRDELENALHDVVDVSLGVDAEHRVNVRLQHGVRGQGSSRRVVDGC